MFSPLHLEIARQRHQDMLARAERRRIANVRDDTAKRSERPAEADRVPLSATPDGSALDLLQVSTPEVFNV